MPHSRIDIPNAQGCPNELFVEFLFIESFMEYGLVAFAVFLSPVFSMP